MPDFPDAECKDLIGMVCQNGGVKESYAAAGQNGCSNCEGIRPVCSTSCNYCYPATGTKDSNSKL